MELFDTEVCLIWFDLDLQELFDHKSCLIVSAISYRQTLSSEQCPSHFGCSDEITSGLFFDTIVPFSLFLDYPKTDNGGMKS